MPTLASIASNRILSGVSARQLSALAALLLGFALLVGAGFAGPSAIHSAVHDTRHSLGLPCH